MENCNKLLIKYEENIKHPHCPHGPTLLFYNAVDGVESGYYACSAYRDKRICNYHIAVKEVTEKQFNKRYEHSSCKYMELNDEIITYCLQCNEAITQEELNAHQDHKCLDLDSKSIELLPALNNDKAHAQYFFDKKALTFFENCLKYLNVQKVICIGAPRLHAHLIHACSGMKSFLLDLDERLFYFFRNKDFALYNMCNNFFFNLEQEQHFRDFLRSNGNTENILLFTDPPFGCRTEPIANTLQSLTSLYNDINNLPHQPIPIFWVFPYFAETYIKQVISSMEMCDYKVNYINHTSYTDVGKNSRKFGSPVRLFTNVPLDRIQLPIIEQYKFCKICDRYTSLENRHCSICGICPSKNGSTYRHCKRCGQCVKPNYKHCYTCRRCTQIVGHNCGEYQKKQKCWICYEVGHIERNCKKWLKLCKKSKKICYSDKINGSEIVCLICGVLGHNERFCQDRKKYIKQTQFMGDIQLTF